MSLNLEKYTKTENNLDTKTAMKNFWQTCFNICKWIIASFIVIVIATAFYSGGKAFYYNVKPINKTISYNYVPKFTIESEQKEITDNKVLNKRISEIVKHLNMPFNCTDTIIKKLEEVSPEDQEDFINNMESYYQAAIDYNIKRWEKLAPNASRNDILTYWKYNDNYRYGIIPLYFDNYTKQKNSIELEQKVNTFQRNLNLYILGGCIILFVILLIIPILIKIEENTRNFKNKD